MPTTDSQFQMGYVSTVILLDLEQDNPTKQSYGAGVFIINTIGLLEPNVYGAGIAVNDTLGLLPVSVYGAPVVVSGITFLRSFLTLNGDIIYYGDFADINVDTINIDTDLAPIDNLSLVASGFTINYGIATSGDIAEVSSGGFFVNQSGIEVVLPSGSLEGTCFSFLRLNSSEFNISLKDSSENIVYSSGSNVKEVALGGLFSYFDLIYSNNKWIATMENNVVATVTGVL